MSEKKQNTLVRAVTYRYGESEITARRISRQQLGSRATQRRRHLPLVEFELGNDRFRVRHLKALLRAWEIESKGPSPQQGDGRSFSSGMICVDRNFSQINPLASNHRHRATAMYRNGRLEHLVERYPGDRGGWHLHPERVELLRRAMSKYRHDLQIPPHPPRTTPSTRRGLKQFGIPKAIVRVARRAAKLIKRKP